MNKIVRFIGIFQQQDAGAPPTVESVTNTEFTTDATAHNVAMPATVTSGNLLLALWANDGTATVTTPVGWNVHIDTTGTTRAIVFSKSAAGTEGGTTVNFVTSASERASAHVFRISGWSGNTTNIECSAANDTAGTARTCPSLTPSYGQAPSLWIVSLHFSGSSTVTVFPSTYGNTLSSNSFTGTTGANLYSCYKTLDVASETPGDFTFSGSTTTASTQIVTAVKGT